MKKSVSAVRDLRSLTSIVLTLVLMVGMAPSMSWAEELDAGGVDAAETPDAVETLPEEGEGEAPIEGEPSEVDAAQLESAAIDDEGEDAAELEAVDGADSGYQPESDDEWVDEQEPAEGLVEEPSQDEPVVDEALVARAAEELNASIDETATVADVFKLVFLAAVEAMAYSDGPQAGTAVGEAFSGCPDAYKAAALFESVCRHLGMACVVVEDPDSHNAWNLVKVGDYWYHVDAWAASKALVESPEGGYSLDNACDDWLLTGTDTIGAHDQLHMAFAIVSEDANPGEMVVSTEDFVWDAEDDSEEPGVEDGTEVIGGDEGVSEQEGAPDPSRGGEANAEDSLAESPADEEDGLGNPELSLSEQSSDIVASGTCGTCPWTIDSDGLLTISSGTLHDPSTGSYQWGWKAYKDQITKVVFTGNVKSATSLADMFAGMPNMIEADCESLDTSSAIDLHEVFSGCSSLEKLSASSWDTSHVKYMNRMFFGCSSLIDTNIEGWNTSSLVSMDNMFTGAASLKTLDLSAWDTSHVVECVGLFRGCGLYSIDLSNWDVSSLVNAEYMFENCAQLKELDLSGWDTSALTDMSDMFSGCSSLKTLNLSEWDTSNLEDVHMAFHNCNSLETLNLEGWNTPQLKSAQQAFEYCNKLTSLDLSGWNTSSLDYSESTNIFRACNSLSEIKVGANWNLRVFPKATSSTYKWWSIKDEQWYSVEEILEYRLGIADTYRNTSDEPAVKPFSGCTVTLSLASYTYDGTQKTPTVTVKDGSTTLVNGVDYDISMPSGRVNAGTYTVTVTGKGNYTGTKTVQFTIAKASPTLTFASTSVSKKTTDLAFTNSLTKTTDGTVTFSSSNTSVATVNSSTGQVTIKGAGETTIIANAVTGQNYKAGSATYSLTVTKPTAYTIHKSVTGSGAIELQSSTLYPTAGSTVVFRTVPGTGRTLSALNVTYTDPATGRNVTLTTGSGLTRTSGSGAMGVSEYSFKMPASDATINATFVTATFAIHKSVIGSGAIELQSSTLYPTAGSTVVFRTVPNAGKALSALNVTYTDPATGRNVTLTTGSGLTRTSGSGATGVSEYSFRMPASDATINATFVTATYAIQKSVTGSGAIEIRSSTLYPTAGSTVVFRAVPNAGKALSALNVTYTDPATGRSVTLTTASGLTRTAGTGAVGSMSEYSFKMPACNVSINATFVSAYTVSYSANGGTGTPSSQVKLENTPLTLSSFKPSKTYLIRYNATGGSVSPASKSVSCTFRSWNTARDGSGSSYQPGGSYTANAEATLYAQWTNPTVGSLATPTRSGYSFEGWYTSATGGQKVSASRVVTANMTLYAHWSDPYNMGDETYSFGNYEDSDSYGHCFGMAMTSAGYHNNLIDIGRIGGNANTPLYSFGLTQTVKQPICYYQKMQGSYARNAIVAGGSFDLSGYSEFDIDSDWQAVVNYVKNHDYDGAGLLELGYWKYAGYNRIGGHSVDFLRYQNVDGQDRLYVYDNNFPDQETYFYLDSSGRVRQAPIATFEGGIDSIELSNVRTYFNGVRSFDATRVIYIDKDTATLLGYSYSEMKCEDPSSELVMYEIPEGVESITIVPSRDYADFVYMDTEYSFGEITDETRGELRLVPVGDKFGSSSASFTIYQADSSIPTVMLSKSYFTYDGSVHKPMVTVAAGGALLEESRDYTVEYPAGMVNAGTYQIKVKLKGDYSGEVTATYIIGKATQTITASDKTVATGRTVSLGASASGGGKLTYSSAVPSVATVSTSGVVTGVSEGTSQITIAAAETDNYAFASKTVTVTVVQSHKISKKVTGGGEIELQSATLYPEGGSTVVFRTLPDTGQMLKAFSVTYVDPGTGKQVMLTTGNGITRTGGDGSPGSKSEYSFTMPNCDVDISATFAANNRTYKITKSMTGAGKAGSNLQLVGSDGKPAGQTADKTAPTMYPKAGQTVYFKSVPAKGAKLTKFNVTYSYAGLDGKRHDVKMITGSGITSHGGGLYSFKMPCYPVTLTGEFTK